MYTYVSESGWRTRYTLQSAMVNKQRLVFRDVASWKQIEGNESLRYSVAECIFRVHASFRDGGTHEGRDEAPRFQQKSTNFDYHYFFLSGQWFLRSKGFFSLSLSFASSWRSFRPAIEKSREIGNVSDPVYGLSLQRFAIECRLYIVLLYVYYLYMYIYIYISLY